MSKTNSERFIMIPIRTMEKRYKGEMSDIDLTLISTIREKVDPTTAIGRISYHGIGDLLGKGHSTIKNSAQKLKELEEIIIEETKQGMKSFRVGVINYTKKDKTVTTIAQLKEILGTKNAQNYKVGKENAKPETNNFTKSDEEQFPKNKPESYKSYINNAKAILENPAKSIDIDKDGDIEPEIKVDEDGGINKKTKGELSPLSQSLSNLLTNESSGRGHVLEGRDSSRFIIKGFDIAKHPDFNLLLIKQFGEGNVISFIEKAEVNCKATTLGQAFGFVYKGLRKRKEEGWL